MGTGYLNSVRLDPSSKSLLTDRVAKVIGSVSTMLRLIYGDRYTKSDTQSNVTSIAFAGTVVGHLAFGFLSDRWSRRNSLLISTVST
jgi:MFS family permease